jgi:ABC-type proline/glycine betaine transport system permease subunit
MRSLGVLSRGRVLLTPVLTIGALLLLFWYVSTIPPRLGDDQVLSRAFLESRLRQHLQIVAISFVLSAVIAVPLGIVLSHAGRVWQFPVFALANLGQAMPGIALLALSFTVAGLGLRTTVFALVIYALLPILRNTVVGMQAVDPAVVEAAHGMGMTPLQTLLRVQLPLIEPALFAGLRTALVLIVGTATLGNFIGGGGLGDVISAGIGAGRDRIVLVGAGMVAALALLADWALGLVETLLRPRT